MYILPFAFNTCFWMFALLSAYRMAVTEKLNIMLLASMVPACVFTSDNATFTSQLPSFKTQNCFLPIIFNLLTDFISKPGGHLLCGIFQICFVGTDPVP